MVITVLQLLVIINTVINQDGGFLVLQNMHIFMRLLMVGILPLDFLIQTQVPSLVCGRII